MARGKMILMLIMYLSHMDGFIGQSETRGQKRRKSFFSAERHSGDDDEDDEDVKDVCVTVLSQHY